MTKLYIQTVLGPVEPSAFRPALPHEHILVDFIGSEQSGPHRYVPDEVVEVMEPYLKEVAARGFRGFVDCTPAFLARDPAILARLSRSTGLHILTNTGLYKEPYLPPYAFTDTVDQLADRWVREWEDGIGETGIKPGFIKIAVNPAPLIPIQQKIVRAAARTSRRTGLTIASHTVVGVAALEQLAILEEEGVDPSRFIAVHMDAEQDFTFHLEVARRGAWVEYDSVGARPIEYHTALINRFLGAGYGNQLLLSHDAGWYRVGEPGGGKVRGFTALTDDLLPALRAQGIDVSRVLQENPARAYAVAG